jgi:predicted MFS family arabinose efflux permease
LAPFDRPDGAPDLTAPFTAARERSTTPALLILALTICSAATMRSVFSPVQEVVKLDLGLSDLQMSFVQGLAASIPIAILSIPLGWMVDRANRVRLLIGLALLWTLGTVLTAFAGDFAALFVTRMLAGLGAICSLPVAISIAADLSPPERRGRALLLLSLGSTIGGAIAFAGGGAVFGALEHSRFAGLAPWRAVHLIFGVVSAVLVGLLFLIKEPERKEKGEEAGTALAPALRELWSRADFLAPLFVGQIGVVMADTAAGIWAAPLLTSGIVGSVLGGLTADAGHKSRFNGGILFGALTASGLSIPAALFPVMPSVAGFAALLALLLVCGAVTGLVTATAIAVLIPNDIRGVCLGAFVVIGAVVGFGLAPTLVSLGSTALGGESHLSQALGFTGLGVSIVSFAAFALATLRAPVKPT